jgi:hypothetical protein|tara:strand:+ start:504 stop:719 length:216 start_codon:yes stop_codon:yes gene_type:complete
MLVERENPFTGEMQSIEIPEVTPEGLARVEAGDDIRQVFPTLDDDLWDYIIAGLEPGTIRNAFGFEKDKHE